MAEGFSRLLAGTALTAHAPGDTTEGFHQGRPVLQELLIAPGERYGGEGIRDPPETNRVRLNVVDNSLPVNGHALQHCRPLGGSVAESRVPLRLLDVLAFDGPLIVVPTIEPHLVLVFRVRDLVRNLERINRADLDESRLGVSEC